MSKYLLEMGAFVDSIDKDIVFWIFKIPHSILHQAKDIVK